MKKVLVKLSKCWSAILCTVSVAILAIFGGCKSSEKAQGNDNPMPGQPPVETKAERNARIKTMQHEADSLRNVLFQRQHTVIYGSPEMLKQRGEQNSAMSARIRELEDEIEKLKQEEDK